MLAYLAMPSVGGLGLALRSAALVDRFRSIPRFGVSASSGSDQPMPPMGNDSETLYRKLIEHNCETSRQVLSRILPVSLRPV